MTGLSLGVVLLCFLLSAAIVSGYIILLTVMELYPKLNILLHIQKKLNKNKRKK